MSLAITFHELLVLTRLELGIGPSVNSESIYICLKKYKKAFVSLGYSYFGVKKRKLLPEINRNT